MATNMRIVKLLGHPVAHSLSPTIHNAAFEAQGLAWRYVISDVPPEDLADAVSALREAGSADAEQSAADHSTPPPAGANVTIPHKQTVLSLLDEVSPRAQAVGAVNTIVCRKSASSASERGVDASSMVRPPPPNRTSTDRPLPPDRTSTVRPPPDRTSTDRPPQSNERISLYGDNTDVEGFLTPLRPFADELQGAEMLIFGSGGAARAVAYALLTTLSPRRLTLAARTPPNAAQIIQDFASLDKRGVIGAVPLEDAGPHVQASALIVNATPVGMAKSSADYANATPWPDAADFREGQIVYDLVYRPARTQLLKDASARGARIIGGLEMLIAQAAASYKMWTGRSMPLDAVRAALARKV